MKESFRKNKLLIFAVLLIAVCAIITIALKPDNSTPTPSVPIEENSSITRMPGNMGYEVNAYKIHTDGLDFLVIVQANKGGVAITRIK